MSESSKWFEEISVVYRSRFLYRSEAEYRSALGVSFETVVNNRRSERDMDAYWALMCLRAGALPGGLELEDAVRDYVEASRVWRELDWGDRTQMASRRRFCRMLFRIYASGGRSLSGEEILKFKIKNDDERLMEAFFPGGTDAEPAVNVGMMVMFAFGVMKPWGGQGARGRDVTDRETMVLLERMRRMIEVLRDDMVRLGSMDKPLVFSEWIEVIDCNLEPDADRGDVTPLWMAAAMGMIVSTCRSVVDLGWRRRASEEMGGLFMRGIWVDNADCGHSRFWVFPDNMLMAFCYVRSGAAWVLEPYEFRVMFAPGEGWEDRFLLINAEGSVGYALSTDNAVDPDNLAKGGIEGVMDADGGGLVEVRLREVPGRLPEWMDWRSWSRLRPDDERFMEFRTALREIYDPGSPQSVVFRNVGPELSDVKNRLVGRDRHYLYVFDREPGRFVMRERGSDGVFEYVAEEAPVGALFELEVTERAPLYLLPGGRKLRRTGVEEVDALAAILEEEWENVDEVYVVHSRRSRSPRLIFPHYGVSVALSMDVLEPLGVRKLTRRPF